MRLPARFATVGSLLCVVACASPPPKAVSPQEGAASAAPITKPSPNDCGGPGSARPCSPPTTDPHGPVRKVCTDMACHDGVTITHRLAGFELAKGKHTFEIDADGAKTSCAIEVTDLAGEARAECTDRLTLTIAPRSEMTTVPPKPGDGPNAPVGAMRTVVPNSTEWQFQWEGKTPKTLRITHRIGTKAVADHKLTPKYEPRSPNGKGCEPTCSQANETIP